ncbi:MAG: oligoendopeptidase F [Bacteroidetes bacterium 4572_77]|nr:MAG: oligoendopeptidase F [Bacteroidetes bacterium 4572_77]
MIKPDTLKRNEIDSLYKWDFSHIYKDWKEWQIDFDTIQQQAKDIEKLKGQLKKGPQQLLQALQLLDQVEKILYKVYAYPALQKSTDNRDNTILAKMQEVNMFMAQLSTLTSWISPEIMEIPYEICMQWIKDKEELSVYAFNLEKIYHQKEHILSESKEKLLSFFANSVSVASNTYTMLTTADVKFPDLSLRNGEKIKLTHGNYSNILNTSKVREDRKNAAELFYPLYADKKNTIAALYKGICDKNWAFARSRNYKSSLQAKLSSNNIPEEVYLNLIETVGQNTKALKDYHLLRAKHQNILGDYHAYDSRVSIIDYDKKYDFDGAKNMVKESVSVLGSDYMERYAKALENGWIDVFENEGKSSGAYSMGVYGVHPFVLMNYNGTQDHVFTLAHEMGHSLHTMFSEENQPFNQHEYTIFVAEVASTFNERLLLDYMLKHSRDKQEKIALLQQSIENIIGTFYTQSMFADFEWQAHKLVENDQPITAESLTEICEKLDKKYYGEEVFARDKENIFWTRIPHFYRSPFYVYQYATSFAASAALYEKVQTGLAKNDKTALNQYLNLLKSGGNDYPVEQLAKAGADLRKKESILAVIHQLEVQVQKLKELLQN